MAALMVADAVVRAVAEEAWQEAGMPEKEAPTAATREAGAAWAEEPAAMAAGRKRSCSCRRRQP